ncbi:LysR substrate-binding domain-containing protein [Defluviimonas sp. D31]|uniref:LysR family transcriptional regulator n=1 Tax=Defluviimonas sp. D31 TaxID=3083253 RepID=UPI00296E588A|nr:LysR substrate-binding domain-containing protein [Defluviimonas sp. D31]MDW4549475.1 LysR substrate-binding domain-containing protein [Defluviimonas sp. D31]
MAHPPDSDLLRSFLAIAEAGSVTAAAERLGRTQSAVSMQIARLEENLGQQLFDRLPRGMALTARGAQLLPYARRVTGLIEEAATALRSRPLDGPVRIGIPQDYSETVLPGILSAFSRRYPAVEVTVRLDYSVPQLKAMAAGELDLAVVFEWKPAGTKGEILCVEPTVWVTSDRHAQHLQTPLPIAVYFDSDWCQTNMIASLDRHGIPYRVAFECDTVGGFFAAVRSGLAVVALSRSTIPDGCRELTLEEGFPAVDSSSVLLHRSSRGASPAVDALAEAIRAAFRPGAFTEVEE